MFDDDIQARVFAQVLSSFRYGVPLWDPKGSDEVTIGDLGYVQGGRYHKIMTGAVPDTNEHTYKDHKPKKRPRVMSEKGGRDTSKPLEPALYPHMLPHIIPNWVNRMLWRSQYSLPREINNGSPENFCTVEAGVSLVAAPEWGYAGKSKEWAKIVCENSRDWLDYADANLPPNVVEDGIIFVTGFIRGNRDWDMYCKVNNHPTLGTYETTQAGCHCKEPEFGHNLKCPKPHHDVKTFNQPMFLRYTKMKRRPRVLTTSRRSVPQLISRIQYSSNGYTQLPDSDAGEQDNGDCDTETLFKHPVDWTLDYIFETSPEAEIAFVSERQIYKICGTCETQPLIQQYTMDEVRGKSWATNNFYFFLQYHRPTVIVVDGVATIDTSKRTLLSVLCNFPLYRTIRREVVKWKGRMLPRVAYTYQYPTSTTLEITIIEPFYEEPWTQKEEMREKSQTVLQLL